MRKILSLLLIAVLSVSLLLPGLAARAEEAASAPEAEILAEAAEAIPDGEPEITADLPAAGIESDAGEILAGSTVISSVALTGVIPPEVGAEQDRTVHSGTEGTDVYACGWQHEHPTYGWCAFDGPFMAGGHYRFHAYVTADDGYVFSGSCTATLNGEAAVTSFDDGMLEVTFAFPALEGASSTVVGSVEITGVIAPEVGVMPNNTSFNSITPGTVVQMSGWQCLGPSGWSSFSGAFQVGKQYRVNIYVAATGGYSFAPDCSATVDGENAETGSEMGFFLARYTYPVLEDTPISSAAVTGVVPPAAGGT